MVVNVFLFDDFEVMDAFGPVEIFGRVPEHFYVRFYFSARGSDHRKTGNKNLDRTAESGGD